MSTPTRPMVSTSYAMKQHLIRHETAPHTPWISTPHAMSRTSYAMEQPPEEGDRGAHVGQRVVVRAGQHGVLLHHVPAPVAGRLQRAHDAGDVHVAGAERAVHPAPHRLGVGELAGPQPVRGR